MIKLILYYIYLPKQLYFSSISKNTEIFFNKKDYEFVKKAETINLIQPYQRMIN